MLAIIGPMATWVFFFWAFNRAEKQDWERRSRHMIPVQDAPLLALFFQVDRGPSGTMPIFGATIATAVIWWMILG